MKPRVLLILLAFAVWCGLCGWWYTCKIKQKCDCNTTDSATIAANNNATADTKINNGQANAMSIPIYSFMNKPEALTNPDFQRIKDSLDILLKDTTKALEIIGHYYANETNTSTFPNMGYARAEQAKTLFANIPQSRIKTGSMEVNEQLTDSTKQITACNFGVVDYVPLPEIKANESKVVTTANGALIYFPSGSTAKKADPNVDKYLDTLANQFKAGTIKNIDLIGHTDDKGEAEPNKALGLKRAEMIKGILVKKGVTESSVTATSQGEQMPIADNSTEAGRAQNRRTEVVIK